MAKTWANAPIRPYRCVPQVKYTDAGEEASQTYVIGAPLVYDSSSKEGEEWAGGTDATTFLGFAARAASGTAATAQPYYEASDDAEFVGTLVNGTATVALAASHIGTKYSLIKDSTTSNWNVDVGDTTTTRVQVIGIGQGAAIGDTNAPVIFKVLTDMQRNRVASS